MRYIRKICSDFQAVNPVNKWTPGFIAKELLYAGMDTLTTSGVTLSVLYLTCSCPNSAAENPCDVDKNNFYVIEGCIATATVVASLFQRYWRRKKKIMPLEQLSKKLLNEIKESKEQKEIDNSESEALNLGERKSNKPSLATQLMSGSEEKYGGVDVNKSDTYVFLKDISFQDDEFKRYRKRSKVTLMYKGVRLVLRGFLALKVSEMFFKARVSLFSTDASHSGCFEGSFNSWSLGAAVAALVTIQGYMSDVDDIDDYKKSLVSQCDLLLYKMGLYATLDSEEVELGDTDSEMSEMIDLGETNSNSISLSGFN